jgi:uncharacterized protein YoxC
VSTLKEDLSELSSALPAIPDEVAGLEQHTQELADAASALFQWVDQERQEVATLLTAARDTMASFTHQIEALEKRLEDSVAATEKEWSDGHAHLTDGEHALETAGHQLDPARADLFRTLAEAGTKVDQASADGEATTKHLVTAAQDGHDRIVAASGEVAHQQGELYELLEATKTSLNEARHSFLARVEQFVTHAVHEIDSLFDHLRDRLSEYVDLAGHQSGKVFIPYEAIIRDKLAPSLHEIGGRAGLAAETARIALETLAAGARSQEEALARARDTLENALEQVDATAAPLHDAVKQIHETLLEMR